MQAQLSSQRSGCWDLVKFFVVCVWGKSQWWVGAEVFRSSLTLSTIWPVTSSIRMMGCSQHKPTASLLRAVHSKHLPTPLLTYPSASLRREGIPWRACAVVSVESESMGLVSPGEKWKEGLAWCPFGTIPVPSGEAAPHQRCLRCLVCSSPFPCNTSPIECILYLTAMECGVCKYK